MTLITGLNKAFDSRIRLGIMATLMVNKDMSFKELKQLLDVTDGNLASHTKALEKLEYIIVIKQFIGKKPNTTFRITKAGKGAFKSHLNALEKLIGK
jgi:DNA-binding MarR family transcriptional regulator